MQRLPVWFVLVIIALFVTLAPMLSQFTYFDTDWGMMSSAPDMESGHYFGTDSSGRDLLVRVAIGGRISLMVGIAAALVAVIVGYALRFTFRLPRRKIDSVMMRLLEILNSFRYVLRHPAGDLLRPEYPADLRGHRDGVLAGYGAYCSRPDAEPQTQRVY